MTKWGGERIGKDKAEGSSSQTHWSQDGVTTFSVWVGVVWRAAPVACRSSWAWDRTCTTAVIGVREATMLDS